MQLSRDELKKAYRRMFTIREFEERLHVDFAKPVTFRASCISMPGRKPPAVGICTHLADDDRIVSAPIAATAIASPRASTCRA